MNTSTKKLTLWSAAAIVSAGQLFASAAQASAATSSYVTVTYTINSIQNLTNPGDLSGLDIVGSFDLASLANNPYQSISGTGSVTPTLTGTGSTSVTGSYSRTLQLDAGADNWSSVSANYLAWFSLAFNNTSATDSYDVDLTLSYDLSAAASGNSAFSDATATFYNEDTSFSNLADPAYVQAAAGVAGLGTLSHSHVFNFTLAAGAAETLYVDAAINATMAPVPLPAAAWSFLIGALGLLGLNRNKSGAQAA